MYPTRTSQKVLIIDVSISEKMIKNSTQLKGGKRKSN
jgi:hypothetical protein